MSSSNRLPYPLFGTGLAIILMVVVGALLARHNPDAQRAKATSSQERKIPPDKGPETGPARASTTPKPNPHPNRQEWRSERDLQAQREMAKWTLVAALAAVGGIGVGILGLKLVYDTLQETKSAVEVAERGIVAAERPWVSIRIAKVGPITFDKKNGQTKLRFELTNFGKSPALNVEVRCEFVPYYQNALKHLVQIVDGAKKVEIPRIFGARIFPGQPIELNQTVWLARASIEKEAEELGLPKNNFIFPAFVGCVVYRSPVDDENHTTEFVVQLGRRDPHHAHGLLAIEVREGKVNSLDLKLQAFLGSGAAD
jgi:hypothetical protein